MILCLVILWSCISSTLTNRKRLYPQKPNKEQTCSMGYMAEYRSKNVQFELKIQVWSDWKNNPVCYAWLFLWFLAAIMRCNLRKGRGSYLALAVHFFNSTYVFVCHPQAGRCYLVHLLLTHRIDSDILDYSVVVEIFRSSIDPADPIRGRPRSSRSRKTSRCGFHMRRAVPQ